MAQGLVRDEFTALVVVAGNVIEVKGPAMDAQAKDFKQLLGATGLPVVLPPGWRWRWVKEGDVGSSSKAPAEEATNGDQ